MTGRAKTWAIAVISVVPIVGSSLLLAGLQDAWKETGWTLAAFIVGAIVVLGDAYLVVRHQAHAVLERDESRERVRELEREREEASKRETERERERRHLIEDDRTRRRCHTLLRQFAQTYLRNDSSLRITVFLRNGTAGPGTFFMPIVRYRSTDQANHHPGSRARFTDGGSKNICAVVAEPLQMFSCAVATQGMDRPKAEAWFVSNLNVDPEAVKLLSDDTLLRTRSLGDIGLSFGRPQDGHHCFGWISFASFEESAFDVGNWPADRKTALEHFVQQISCQLAPVPESHLA